MANATKISTLPLEPHDAPRANPPASPMTEPEATAYVEPQDAALDNPYDNIACTD